MKRISLPADLAMLDPAGTRAEDAHGARAQEMLARIVTSDGASAGFAPGPLPTYASPTRRRWPLMAGAAAAVVAVVLASVLGGRPESAFATWTAVPSPASPADARELGERCAAMGPAGDAGAADIAVVLAERRGDLTFTAVLDAEAGELTACLGGTDYLGAGTAGDIDHDATFDRDAVTVVTQTGTYSDPPNPESPAYTALTGRVGPGVESIEIHTDDGRRVVASIDGSWWGAWWPGLGGPPRIMARGTDGQVWEVPTDLTDIGIDLRF
ncbi:hypothetical protein [Georgenia faecalis]|uniref:DUF4179 domain-containing protein n=1 Tax=Georgenia faecalis TaxID=2483799 RepID=A0ABV9DB87_9MICO|nr:hypothetical protein [Georgenia faecalis]